MMDRSFIDPYELGGSTLRQAVTGLSAEDLKAVPIPGKWSTHQVIIHLADAEAAFADRIKRIIAQDEPQLLAWDENRFTARLHYESQSSEDALESIAIFRRQVACILRAASDADLDRAGIHTERGRQTINDVVGMAVWHLNHHLKFIHDKRIALKK